MKRVFVIFFSTVVLLSLLEAILALLFLTSFRKHVTVQPLSFLASRYYLAHRRNCQEMQFDPQLTYVLIPNHSNMCKGIEYEVSIHTNSKGLRDTEQALVKPKMIALGDSFTFGHGVTQDQTWPKLLQRITKENVLNAGVESYGTAREVELLKRLDTSDLNYLVIQYHVSDLHENIEYIRKGFRVSASVNQKQFNMWIRLLHEMKYYPGLLIHDSASFLRLYSKKNLNRTTEQIQQDTEAHVAAFLKILNTIKLPRPTRLIVTTVGETSWWRSSLAVETTLSEISGQNATSSFDTNYFLEQVRRRLNEHGNSPLVQRALVVDPQRVLTDDAYFIVDDHLNAIGHERLAKQIAEEIARAGSLN